MVFLVFKIPERCLRIPLSSPVSKVESVLNNTAFWANRVPIKGSVSVKPIAFNLSGPHPNL